MAIEEVFRHQMGGVERCDPLRLRVEENQEDDGEEVYGRFYGGWYGGDLYSTMTSKHIPYGMRNLIQKLLKLRKSDEKFVNSKIT